MSFSNTAATRQPDRIFAAGGASHGLAGMISPSGSWKNRHINALARNAATPNGYLHPMAWVLPRIAGGLSDSNLASATITGTALLVNAQYMIATATAAITGTGALDQIYNAAGSATLAITGTGALSALIAITGSSTMAISGTGLLGGTFSVAASSSMALSVTLATLTAKAFMEATAGGPEELSAAGLAEAVWSAVAASHNAVGTMGEKLNDAGSAGNPWAALLADNNDTDTFGERIQKLLTTVKFVALK